MRLDLTEEQQLVQAMAREFAADAVKPIAGAIDRDGRFPHETVKRMGELGLLGMTIDESWGGGGADAVSFALAVIEIARVCATHAIVMIVNNSLFCEPVQAHGTEEQKARFLAPCARGERLGCFALTEPAAGSDAANQQTLAVRDGDHYVVNGRKLFITTGREASAVLLFCQADRSQGRRGILALVVEKGTPGFSVPRVEDKLGIRASDTAELLFEDCRVPVANRLGEEGQGFRIAMATLTSSRIAIAAQAVGIAQGAFDLALAYARERKAFGVPIGQHQMIQWMLADMATAIDGARLLTLRAATLKDAGQPYVAAASMAKYFASEAAMKAAGDAVQIHGGYGYTRDYQVERFFRDAKITQLYEGTTQIQKLIIAREVLGLQEAGR